MQYMATISLDLAQRSEIERTIPAEQARVAELHRQGRLEARYVPDGTGAPARLWAVFNGDSPEAVQNTLQSLPLYPFMRVDLAPLRPLGEAA